MRKGHASEKYKYGRHKNTHLTVLVQPLESSNYSPPLQQLFLKKSPFEAFFSNQPVPRQTPWESRKIQFK